MLSLIEASSAKTMAWVIFAFVVNFLMTSRSGSLLVESGQACHRQLQTLQGFIVFALPMAADGEIDSFTSQSDFLLLR